MESFVNIFMFIDFKGYKDNNEKNQTKYNFDYKFDSKKIVLIPKGKEFNKSDVKKVFIDAIAQFENIIVN